MSTLQELSETRITLRSTEAVVESVKNGIPMNRRRVEPSDLAFSMLGILEDESVVSHLLREKTFSEVFENFFNFNHMNGESLADDMTSIIDMALNYLVECEYDGEIIKEFFLTLVSRFDPTDFSESETANSLRKLLSRVVEFEDRTEVENLFYYLLDEVNLLGDLKGGFAGKVLEQIFKRAKGTLDKELIHSLFKVTSTVADKEWVLEVLESHIPKKKACSSPILPKNCFVYQEMIDGAKIVGIEVEAQRFNIQYHRKQFDDVGHPNMLFLFTLRGQKVLNCRIVCVKDQVLTPDTSLYRYPFSNVSENTGTCWPDLNSYRVKSIAHVGTMPFAFLNSSNNEHLFQGVNLGEKYMELQENDFDHDTLKPLNLTLSAWLEVSKESLQ